MGCMPGQGLSLLEDVFNADNDEKHFTSIPPWEAAADRNRNHIMDNGRA